jgi:hypothetical protein
LGKKNAGIVPEKTVSRIWVRITVGLRPKNCRAGFWVRIDSIIRVSVDKARNNIEIVISNLTISI